MSIDTEKRLTDILFFFQQIVLEEDGMLFSNFVRSQDTNGFHQSSSSPFTRVVLSGIEEMEDQTEKQYV
jgi:hypothetical protein